MWRFLKRSRPNPEETGTSTSSDNYEHLTRDEISILVYRELNSKIERVTDLSIWLSGDYISGQWEIRLAHMQRQIDTVREWTKANTTGRVREEYMGWLRDFYQHGVDSAWKELKHQSIRIEHEKNDKRLESKRIRIDQYPNFPSPPKMGL